MYICGTIKEMLMHFFCDIFLTLGVKREIMYSCSYNKNIFPRKLVPISSILSLSTKKRTKERNLPAE